MGWNKLFYLISGGALGTIARYLLGGWISRITGPAFPYGTLAVNVSGCLVVGLLAGMAQKKMLLNSDLKLLLMAGFCGAFTTFSTFILETDELLKSGAAGNALLNILLSVLIGFAVFRLWFLIAELV